MTPIKMKENIFKVSYGNKIMQGKILVCEPPFKNVAPVITPQEINDAKTQVLKQIQFEAFEKEIQSLNRRQNVTLKSELSSVNPTFNNNGF